MSRRTAGLVLTGFGSFAIAAAVTLALVAPTLIRIPLVETVRGTASGTGLTVFSPADLTQRSDVDVVSRRVTTGDGEAPGAGPRLAVWTSGTVLTDTDGGLIATDEITYCLDRVTAAATQPCPPGRRNGSGDAAFAGQVERFPLGTQRRDYALYDATTDRAWPVLFDDTDLVDGLDVNRFVQQVPATVVGQQEVPGELAGGPAGTPVRADVVYSGTRTVWVEPRTGIIVKDVQEPLRYLRAPDGDPVAVLLFGSIGSDEPSIADSVARAAEASTRILLLRRVGPLGLGLLGLAALAAGLVGLRTARRARPVRRSVTLRPRAGAERATRR